MLGHEPVVRQERRKPPTITHDLHRRSCESFDDSSQPILAPFLREVDLFDREIALEPPSRTVLYVAVNLHDETEIWPIEVGEADEAVVVEERHLELSRR